MASPQLPADEALERRVALVHERASSTATECQRLPQVQRLSVVEDVTLAVVCRSAAWRLISELRTPLYRQRLQSDKYILYCYHKELSFTTN